MREKNSNLKNRVIAALILTLSLRPFAKKNSLPGGRDLQWELSKFLEAIILFLDRFRSLKTGLLVFLKKNLIHAAAVAAKIAHCKAPIKQPLWALLLVGLAGNMKKKSETWAPEKRRRGDFFFCRISMGTYQNLHLL